MAESKSARHIAKSAPISTSPAMFLSQEFKGLSTQWNERTGRIGASSFANSRPGLPRVGGLRRDRLLPLALTEEEGVLLAPRAKAPRCRRPAHLHRGLRSAEAEPHRYRALCAAVSHYRVAVLEHRRKGLQPSAVAPYHRASRQAAVLQAAVPVRHSSLRRAGAVLHQRMAPHRVPARPLLNTGIGAFRPNRSCSSRCAIRRSGSSGRRWRAGRRGSRKDNSRVHHRDPRRSSGLDVGDRLDPR